MSWRTPFKAKLMTRFLPGNMPRMPNFERVVERWNEEEVEEFRSYWRKWDGYDFLKTTDIPILELYGDRGREKPSLDKLRIPARDNVKVQWMENASHNLQIECPREVAQACTDFITEVEGTGR